MSSLPAGKEPIPNAGNIFFTSVRPPKRPPPGSERQESLAGRSALCDISPAEKSRQAARLHETAGNQDREGAGAPGAPAETAEGIPMTRREARVERKTRETDIRLNLAVDGSGAAKISTPVGFLTHMLETFARHSCVDLTVSCTGDTHVDAHHLVEDVGIVLGTAFDEALGDKKGIRRFGFASVPMDEALVQVSVDLSGRPFHAIRGEMPKGRAGDFDVELACDFLAAFAASCRCNLHVEVRSGRSGHHVVEAAFKALARAIREAVSPDPGLRDEVPSAKGSLR